MLNVILVVSYQRSLLNCWITRYDLFVISNDYGKSNERIVLLAKMMKNGFKCTFSVFILCSLFWLCVCRTHVYLFFFLALLVKFSDTYGTPHQFFIKQHKVRDESDDRPSDLTLFVCNVPPYYNEVKILHSGIFILI